MKIQGVSHFAIGTTDMERALRLYRDVLGLTVVRDNPGQPSVMPGGRGHATGHVVHLSWGSGPYVPFITLTQHEPVVGERAVPLNHLGVNHVGIWIEDFDETVEKLMAHGVTVVMAPFKSDGDQYPGGESNIHSIMFEDPDGTVIQLDHRLPR